MLGAGAASSVFRDTGGFIRPLVSTDGALITASSTIGRGTPATGLTVNGTATTTTLVTSNPVGTAYGGTGLTNPGSLSTGALLQFNGSGGASSLSAGAAGAVIVSDSNNWGSGSINLASTNSVGSSILPIANGGTGKATFTSSQLLYGNGINALSSVATTSASCSGSISCSGFTVIGASPITISASAVASPIATSSSETAGQLAYWTSTSATPATVGKVPTTTLSFSGPFNGYSTLGALVGGSNSTVTWWGLSTTSQPASSNLLVSNGAAGVYGVATTSETCSGVVNCAAHTVLAGGGAITISGGSNGQVLGWLNGIPAWTASSSVAAGTGISISTAGAVTTVTNTGVISGSCSGGTTCSGTNPLAISSFSYPWTPTTNFGVTVNATSGIPFYQNGLHASSTSRIDAILLGSSTVTTFANAPLVMSGTQNNYLQDVLQNQSTGSNASACRVVHNNVATDSTFYGELCINGSGYTTAAYNAQNASDVSLTASDGALVIGTASTTNTLADIRFTTGGTASSSIRAIITAAGKFGIGSTTPWAKLAIHGTTNDTTPTNPLFAIASSTTSATSTLFSINRQGGITLSASQPATSTAMILDWSATPPQVEYRIGTAATTISLINATTSAQWGSRKLVWVCNPGAAAGALTWQGVEWIGATPTQDTTTNECDVYSFDVTLGTSTTIYKVAGSQGTGFK